MELPNFNLMYVAFIISFTSEIYSLKSDSHLIKSFSIGACLAYFILNLIMAIYYIGANK